MTPSESSNPIDAFVREVQATRKYRHICEDTIRDVIETALPRYKRTRDAVKTARTKLHRIQAAYLGQYVIAEHLDAVRQAHQAGDVERLKSICRRLMQDHASTRERIGLLDTFYQQIFAVTGRPRTILDVACGLHPITIPWMDLPAGTVYYAYEIAADLVDCLNRFLQAIGMAGTEAEPPVRFQDVICTPPQETGDLAFLMKMVPCLERRQKGIAAQLIDSLKVHHVVVTFPIRSLAGRSKQMPEFYTRSFTEMAGGRGWRLTKLPIEGELVFVVEKT